MEKHCTFLSLLFLPGICFVIANAYTLPIGAILDTNSRIGKEQKVAIEVAVQRFSSSSQLVILNTIDLRSNNPRQAASYAQGLIQQGAQIIISTGTWPQLLSISDVGEESKVPTVSLTPSTLLGKPFLTQFSYPDSALVNCLVDLVKSYKWQRVITVYEDDVYKTVSSTAQQLPHALQDVGASLDYSAVFPSMDLISDPTTTIRAELARMKQYLSTVYIILRSSENLTLSLFREASTLGMMEQGSVWICGPDIVTLLDSTLNGSFILNYMQGVIGVEPYIKESEPAYIRFHSEFQQAFRSEYEKNGETSFNPGVYAVRAYDAIHAISLAANWSNINGNSLMDNLERSNFMGLSGVLRTGTIESIEKVGNYSNFRVVNIIGKSYKVIGYWSEGFGFYKDESQINLHGLASQVSSQQLTVLLWPGETNRVPGGLRRLKVGVPVNPPEYAAYGFVKVDNETNNYTGFCVDIFTAALGRLNFTINFDFVPFIINDSHITFDDFLHQVYIKNYDIAIGDITITSARSKKVSFTEPFIESGLTMIVPLKHENSGFLLIAPFHWKLWVTFFGLLIYNFIAIWVLEIKSRDGDNSPCQQIGETFWIVGNTFFQNVVDKIKSYYARIVIISWLLVLLIMISCFTANLSSILVIEKLKPIVDKSIVGCEDVSFVLEYVERVLQFKSIKPIKVPEDFSREFREKSITAAIMESPYARIFLSKHENYAIYGDTQMLGGFGFALQKSNPLTSELSRAILELQEDGTIKNLEPKWFRGLLSGSEITTNNVNAKRSLPLDEFMVLFIFGYAVVTFTLGTYFIRNRGNCHDGTAGGGGGGTDGNGTGGTDNGGQAGAGGGHRGGGHRGGPQEPAAAAGPNGTDGNGTGGTDNGGQAGAGGGHRGGGHRGGPQEPGESSGIGSTHHVGAGGGGSQENDDIKLVVTTGNEKKDTGYQVDQADQGQPDHVMTIPEDWPPRQDGVKSGANEHGSIIGKLKSKEWGTMSSILFKTGVKSRVSRRSHFRSPSH